ncbi:Succinyl-diaminopimelate desuccinylase [Candidatus Kinetoplastibacterium sorsogonicusi]|uniref:Succinyl-diaminopimelate desuccinylase n=1 Tax=Candidatus Kinetoplastidibacterium kentomonadis TaxID=1576550 RepID=A0A3S7J9K7_9PROT|nr:succinyl-diaminopimelate desuccinylase [Candidatus Kinetoplastibacterium sorsogonicusi]AWD32350.1 Succinyl-diaminopimelate desuccinylase [Candidatus Kinetoplastibacterium sorsogonicusi]
MSNLVLKLVKDLINCPSITPDDHNCQKIIVDKLSSIGFKIEFFNKNGVTNLWAVYGNNSPLLVFAGHTDVVPPGPLNCWNSDPFHATERNGFLYGRGAADMKSSIAAFIIAIEELIRDNGNNFFGSIGILLTSDEEGPAKDGTLHVCQQLKQRNLNIDYCIVGEPTSEFILGDTCKKGRRGSLSAHLSVKGIEGHIAYPKIIDNPIHKISIIISDLVNTKWDNGNEYFEPTSFQISNIHAGNGATNVVPGTVELDFNLRFSSEIDDIKIKNIVNNILKKYNTIYDINWNLNAKPFITKSGLLTKSIIQAIKSETGIETKLSTSGGTSDGRFLIDIADEVIEFGPCNNTIHKYNECIKISDLEKMKNIYKHTLELLLI